VAETGPGERRTVLRDAAAVSVATGAYGLSFGAISVSAGLTLAQTCALSVLMFTGASQFALVGVVGAGGAPLSAAATATLLGTRNALYGLRLAGLLGLRGPRRLLGAQLVIDESAAMATGRGSTGAARLGFWVTGVGVFLLWNLATLLGAAGGALLDDPGVLGLDAAVPAAFLALLAPRLRAGSEARVVALGAALVALAVTPFTPAGVPVLCAALVALVAGWPRAAGGPGGPSRQSVAGGGS